MSFKDFRTLFRLVLLMKSCFSVPLSDFYPYGVNEGDTVLPANDDGSSGEIGISVLFPYFDRNHDSLFVSNVCFSIYSLFSYLTDLDLGNLAARLTNLAARLTK